MRRSFQERRWWTTPASLLVAGAVACAAVAVTVNQAMASGSAGRLATTVSVAALVALAVGAVAGLPVVVVVATAFMVLGTALATFESDSELDLRVAYVVPSVWLAFELAMRSMELRPATRPGAASLGEWIGVAVSVAAGSVGVVLITGTAVAVTPIGGPSFRVLSVVGVVVVVVALGIINLWRRPAGRARA